MALEDLNPAVRVEEILDGADIEPATRLEYFMKKAANEVPKPAGSSDAGKVVTVNEDGDGYELGEIPSGLPEFTSADNGKVLTIDEGEPKWEAVSGYIYTASSTFQSGIMGLLQTAVTDMATNNKTFAFAEGIILSDEDAAAVSEMGANPARARILRAINQDFAVVRSDGESITAVLPYYEKAISTQLTYYLSMSFTLGALSKKCFVRVTLLGHS